MSDPTATNLRYDEWTGYNRKVYAADDPLVIPILSPDEQTTTQYLAVFTDGEEDVSAGWYIFQDEINWAKNDWIDRVDTLEEALTIIDECQQEDQQ